MHTAKNAVLKQMRRHKVSLGCFAFVLIYQWLIVNNGSLWWVNPSTYALYVLDYGMGFCSKILPGAVYMALVGKYDYRFMSAFVMVFFLALLALLAYFAEKFYASAGPREKKTALLMLFFFFTGPFTVGLFANAFGMLDFYWFLFFFTALPLLPKRRLKWFLPLPIVGMIFVHYAALFSYAALLLLMILFFAAKTEDRAQKREYYILFAACSLITVALAGYFIQFETENVTCTVEELDRILREERGARFPEYVESAMFRITDPSFAKATYEYERILVDPDAVGLTRFMQWIGYFIWLAVSFPHPYERLLFPVLLELPAAAFLIALMISWFRARKGNRELRFVALMMILFFFGVNVVSFLFSSDNFRWMSHAFTCLFLCTLSVLTCDYREGFQKARAFFCRVGLPLTAVYAVVYALTTMDPYV